MRQVYLLKENTLMPENASLSIYKALAKAISYAAGMVILLWLLFKVTGAILLLVLVIIMALVINAPVVMLEKRGMKRGWACAVVFGCILIVIVLLSWLIIPKISDQLTALVTNLPGYAAQISKHISSWFTRYPDIQKEIAEQGVGLSGWVPSIPKTLLSVGNYSLSILTSILIGILFLSMVVYAVTNPRPLLQLYFSFFPLAQHEKATKALSDTSTMLIGWFKANLIGGTIRAVCITIFLSIMGVPGAFIWGAVAFFSELIPKLGFYTAAIPPILVALSISAYTGLWVTIFFLAMDEIMGDFVLPKLRSNSMNIHPVSTLFILLAMGAAFGVMGALLATPFTAIIKAYYEAFFIKRFKEDANLEERIDTILYHRKSVKEFVSKTP
ncbi:MAG TPA: AI-2E family transporter [Chitinophagaceae bacterium]|nr:AI-2E family transporter [Chitinophagaceae bacterium]